MIDSFQSVVVRPSLVLPTPAAAALAGIASDMANMQLASQEAQVPLASFDDYGYQAPA
jgi:hypothetical protein